MKIINFNELPEQGVSHNARIRKRQILLSGAIPGITNYARAVFPPGEKAGAHTHPDMTEVFTVESGCGQIRIHHTTLEFSSGMTAVVEPGEEHEIVNTGGSDLVVTYFGIVTDRGAV